MVKEWVIALCMVGQPVLADCVILDDFALRLEGDVGLVETEQGVTLVFEPEGRLVQFLELRELAGPPDTAMPDIAVLGNGLTLRYAIPADDAEPVGSGGKEVRLEGWIDSTPAMAVTCGTQGENPDAEWCLPVLGSLRPVAAGCGG